MDPFGQSEDDQKQAIKDQAWRDEQVRRSNDIVRVYNPTEEDFVVVWEGFRHKVPAKGTLDTVRYIAETYMRDMHVKLVNEENQKKGEEMLAKRSKSGAQPFESKWHENQEIWNKLPKTDDRELKAKNYDILLVGMVKEFGKDDIPTRSGNVPLDLRSDDEKILESLRNKRVTELAPLEETVLEPVLPATEAKSKEALVKEVTQ